MRRGRKKRRGRRKEDKEEDMNGNTKKKGRDKNAQNVQNESVLDLFTVLFVLLDAVSPPPPPPLFEAHTETAGEAWVFPVTPFLSGLQPKANCSCHCFHQHFLLGVQENRNSHISQFKTRYRLEKDLSSVGEKMPG